MDSSKQLEQAMIGSVVVTGDGLCGWVVVQDARPALAFLDGEIIFLEPGEPLFLIADPYVTARHYCSKFVQPIPAWRKWTMAILGITMTCLLAVFTVAVLLVAAFAAA